MEKEFYFNTGVRCYSFTPPVPCNGEYECMSSNGVKLIRFYCKDVPEKASFLYACNNPNLATADNIIVREIIRGGLCSKYAYFRIY